MTRSISILRAMLLMWVLALCSLGLCLACTSVTGIGVVAGVATIMLGVSPFLWMWDEEMTWMRYSGMGALVAWLCLTIFLAWHAPSGKPPAGARVSNHYSDGQWKYPSAALGSLLPEMDQLSMGFAVMPVLDRLLTRKQSTQLKSYTQGIYAELEADPGFAALGTALPQAYDNMLGREFDVGHYFLYVPSKVDPHKPTPALVFLHGFGGNFKAYTWILSQVAEELGYVLICPTYGAGFWDARHSPEVVSRAVRDVAKTVALDMKQIHLAGLSNGGLGVGHVASAGLSGEAFRSLIFISPVFDEKAITCTGFRIRCRQKPVLVITGMQDDRVPALYVQDNVGIMKSEGVDVTTHLVPNADHFLFFSHRQEMTQKIVEWLQKQQEAVAAPKA